MIGGCLTMVYRGFFMAATPLFAARVAEFLIPRGRVASMTGLPRGSDRVHASPASDQFGPDRAPSDS
jgi:hypothetical protein